MDQCNILGVCNLPNKPVAGEPTIDKPVAEKPITDKPTAPAIDEPAVEQPIVDEPAAEQPTVNEPAAEQPIVDEPAAKQPTINEPAAKQPTVNKPTTIESRKEILKNIFKHMCECVKHKHPACKTMYKKLTRLKHLDDVLEAYRIWLVSNTELHDHNFSESTYLNVNMNSINMPHVSKKDRDKFWGLIHDSEEIFFPDGKPNKPPSLEEELRNVGPLSSFIVDEFQSGRLSSNIMGMFDGVRSGFESGKFKISELSKSVRIIKHKNSENSELANAITHVEKVINQITNIHTNGGDPSQIDFEGLVKLLPSNVLGR